MAITQPTFKLEPPDLAWQQIKIIPTGDNNDVNNNNDNNNNKNNNNDDEDDEDEDEKSKCQ